jgi:hypothetical protein
VSSRTPLKIPGWWTIRQEGLWAKNRILKQDLDCDAQTL